MHMITILRKLNMVPEEWISEKKNLGLKCLNLAVRGDLDMTQTTVSEAGFISCRIEILDWQGRVL